AAIPTRCRSKPISISRTLSRPFSAGRSISSSPVPCTIPICGPASTPRGSRCLRRDPKSLLWDAHEAAEASATMTAGKSFGDFDADIVLRSAVERQFEIIGEALAQLARLDPVLAQRIPDFREIIAFRNVLIHGYATVDRARVWQVVQGNLPQLRIV